MLLQTLKELTAVRMAAAYEGLDLDNGAIQWAKYFSLIGCIGISCPVQSLNDAAPWYRSM